MMTLTAMLEGLRSGRISARQLVEQSLATELATRHLNSFVWIDAENALAAADQADAAYAQGRARPLEGVPIAVKDNLAVAGQPFTGGSHALGAALADADAGAVAPLRAAGAIIMGKTGLHEFAFGVTSNNGAFGPIGNPAAPDRSSGGSSGGAAAAVAAGIVPVCLGTDTGGSGRIPASFCGCTGYRPTSTRYPVSGIMQLTWSLDAAAVLAASVCDIKLIDDVITGEKRPSVPAVIAASSLRLGVPRSSFAADCDPPVAAAFARALDSLAAAKVELVDVDLDSVLTHDHEAALAIALFEGAQIWRKVIAERGMVVADFIAAISSPDVRGIFSHMLGEGIAVGDYAVAMNKHLLGLRHAYARCFAVSGIDALVFPAVPVTAPPLCENEVVYVGGEARPLFPTIVRNASPGALGGLPGISIPFGTAGGLPFGLEVDGPAGSDRKLMAIARCIQEEVPIGTEVQP